MLWGKGNEEVAHALAISEERVITLLRNIFAKLAANDRTAARRAPSNAASSSAGLAPLADSAPGLGRPGP